MASRRYTAQVFRLAVSRRSAVSTYRNSDYYRFKSDEQDETDWDGDPAVLRAVAVGELIARRHETGKQWQMR